VPLRRCASVVTINGDGTVTLVTKGAFTQIVESCDRVHDGGCLDQAIREQLERRYEGWASQGVRVLAVATRILPAQDTYSRDDEQHMVFVRDLRGSPTTRRQRSRRCAWFARRRSEDHHRRQRPGGQARRSVGGSFRAEHPNRNRPACHVRQRALAPAEQVDVFAEVDPSQKERIILALKATGHVVGFLGDAVNDAPAMHAADTSLAADHDKAAFLPAGAGGSLVTGSHCPMTSVTVAISQSDDIPAADTDA
jgi:Mg2+-importing ATPase